MIVHCKTVEQLEDVIKTEGLILSKTDINTLAWYVGTEKFEVCIDTKNSTWYNSRNAKSTITPYADWKLLHLIKTQQKIHWNNGIKVSRFYGHYQIRIYNELREQGWNISDTDLFNKIKYYEEMEKMLNKEQIEAWNESNDQFIQLECGKLNITKAKELGLFIEDKKVFTVDEDCEIKYNDYKITSNLTTLLDRIIRIYKNNEQLICLTNPTPDKVRHEFSYYGIEVDVI